MNEASAQPSGGNGKAIIIGILAMILGAALWAVVGRSNRSARLTSPVGHPSQDSKASLIRHSSRTARGSRRTGRTRSRTGQAGPMDSSSPGHGQQQQYPPR